MINISASLSELRQARRDLRLIRAMLPGAYYSALNRVSQRVKTESSRKVREVYHVKAKAVKDRVTLRRGSLSNPYAELRWKGKNSPIINFRTNPSKPREWNQAPKMLKAAVRKTGLKPIKGAFVARVGRGEHIGVFRRVGRRRLPIEEIFGPAVPVMVNEPRVISHIEETAKTEMEKRLEHEIDRRLSRVDGIT